MAEKLRTTPTARDVAAALISCSKAHAAVEATRAKVAGLFTDDQEDEDSGDARRTS
jgi:hypothetical protein